MKKNPKYLKMVRKYIKDQPYLSKKRALEYIDNLIKEVEK